MQIIDKLYKGYVPLYPIEKFCPVEKALFVDIETTGLKKETTSLYLIGCGFYTSDGFMTRLFFADNSSEEELILNDFASFIKGFSNLFHFNGLKFDIPYLEYKAGKYNMTGMFDGIVQTDVYRLCAPLRFLLFPDSMRQKAIESFLGIPRDDLYNGGELIEVYKRYESTPNESDLSLLVTHNREDVLGMHLIMPILSYLDFKDADLEFIGYTINRYTDYNGDNLEELLLEYSCGISVVRSFTSKTGSMYLKYSAETSRLLIRLPIYTCEMKIFFDDWRNYRYLPGEDTVILKELAATLSKDRYIKATKETCYQRVSGKFVKQPSDLFKPVLKTAYKDKKKYFRFPDSFNKEAADEFGRSLINIFFTMKRRN